MRSPGRDTLVGIFVMLGMGAIAYLSLSIGGASLRPGSGITLVAGFDELGGLKPRAPVVISGVKVGQVRSVELGQDYRAKVTLDLEPGLELPADTTASIVTSGLLGDRYVSLQLGGETQMLKDGDTLSFTESAVLLERLLGKLVHNVGRGEKDDGGDEEKAEP
jgi:phospholipid/cholesterol/gamma-HCH transport system substrate-binding protein